MSIVSGKSTINPAWTRTPIRLDPAVADRKISFDIMDGEELVSYRVDRRGAVVRRMYGGSNVPVSVPLAPSAFRGVAARAMEEAAGHVTVTLELLHEDASLSVPLLVATDLFDVAADWRSWADLFALPMLMVEADGTVTALDDTLGQLRAASPADRRRNYHKGRRPRFLVRRKPGGLAMRMKIEGHEIIARK
ncbi:hypothetical protein FPY71_05045 [Aureimonas fodinaquatilis]|uniref:Uncharacterized protein n=1 Tax=Aureimonas fodinaquatilis TaxID=2565783 RepID=A0A5B0E4V2_9HYPH|nr:DUF6101 family protein [Aureimonas fodinaquatilis]KAA0972459.1 hypothetical protein FPY71_05045 [Aureimonas fodinaquatilis]